LNADPTLDAILAIIRTRHGRSRRITAEQISTQLAEQSIYCCERTVRKLLSEAERRDDFPVLLGGQGGEGFFVVAELDEAMRRRVSLAGQLEKIGKRLDAFDRRARLQGFDLKKLTERTAS
jgi:hypothetical protein